MKIEEIPSYCFTLKENSNSNGIVEEFSEKEERDDKKKIKRGVSIVSVSDDDSFKALSRDVSTDDVNCQYEVKTNGVHENSKHVEENIIEEYGANHAIRYKETIIEECYVENGHNGEIQDVKEEKSLKAGKLSRQSSKMERFNSAEVEDKQEVILQNGRPQNAELGENKLSRQNSKLERVESIEKKIVIKDLEASQTPEVKQSKLSKQNSKFQRLESLEEKKAVVNNGETPQTPEVTENKIIRRSSTLERLESIEEKKVYAKETETPEPPVDKLSRQNSRISRVNSLESKPESVCLSRQSSQRSNSIVNGNHDDDDDDLDDKTRELFDRIKRQRSVLEEILDKEADKKDKIEANGHEGEKFF